MPLVEITAVGGMVKPIDDDRYRPKVRGDRVNVSEEDALRLVAHGTARLVDDGVAEHAETEQPDGGVIDLSGPLPALRKFADARRIKLRDGRNRAMVVEDIEAHLTDPDTEEGDG